MTSGSLWHSPAAGAAGWLFIAGRSFIAAVNAGAALGVIERLWRYADVHDAAIEDIVGAVPLGADDSVHSFAVVSLAGQSQPDASERTITAVVRGAAVVDVFSVGGSRRFSAGAIQPWMLADFRSVTAVMLGGDDQPTGPAVQTGTGSLPLVSGVVRGERLLWSLAPVPFGRPAGRAATFAPGPAPTVATPAASAATTPVGTAAAARQAQARSDSQRLDDIDIDKTIIAVRGRRRASDLEDDTVLVSRGARRAASASHDPERPAPERPDPDRPVPDRPDPDQPDPDQPVSDQTGTIRTVDDAAYRFRLAGSSPRPLNRPTVFGRNPSGPRMTDGADPLLITVDSPDAAVSSTHLRIEQEGSWIVVTDLRSTNGTIVRPPHGQQRLLRPGEAAVVLVGTTIDIGDGNIIEIMPRESALEPAFSPGSIPKGSA